MSEINREMIGQKLRELRGERTIKDVSEATGLGWSTICSYELGYRIPDDNNKVILSKYYGLTVQELFFDGSITGSDNCVVG